MAMRIIAGAFRGRPLQAPAGETTRPTSQRLRQMIFDMLMHAPWGGRAMLEDARILDVFAGTGAMGLEALSRGAGQAVFVEQAPAALAALKANIVTCRAEGRCRILAADARHPPPGEPHDLVFIDPPYDQGLVHATLAALRQASWIIPGSLIISEYARMEGVSIGGDVLASRSVGPAQVTIWREA